MSEAFLLILNVVKLLNRIMTTGVLITAFALVIYIALYNRRSMIARGFIRLLLCLISTFLADLLAQIALQSPDIWLRAQWIGIAFIPAAALDLSDDLLRATGDISPTRRFATYAAYGMGGVVLLLVLLTSLVATSGMTQDDLPHLTPGILFIPFTLYYFGSALWAIFNVIEARRRALTATTKRRMTYFAMAFPAPILSIFPYLLPSGWPQALPEIIPWLMILLVNMGVGAATTFIGYTIAYFGAGAPDRVIKRRMIKYLIRGPLLAALVITAFVLSDRVERLLGVPSAYIGLIAASATVLLAQLFVVTLQPTLDRLIASDDAEEVSRLQSFSDRLMTTSDLRQFLENILAALCDLLRARTAFVMQIGESRDAAPLLVTIGDVNLEQPEAVRSAVIRAQPSVDAPAFTDFIRWNNYWLIPLHASENGKLLLGVIGLIARGAEPDLTDEERNGIELLVTQSSRALEDSVKQRRAFEALERIVPEASEMTRRLSGTRNPAAPTLSDFEIAPQGYDDFTHVVREALSQYWGGPKLADSPLMNLQVVAEAMKENKGNATRALQSVLNEAIDRLKPDGARSMTATEWMLYNILELKVLQGQKVRDVARKLVMSESDLYRKQRAAFEEVAQVVMEMERESRAKQNGDSMQAADGDERN